MISTSQPVSLLSSDAGVVSLVSGCGDALAGLHTGVREVECTSSALAARSERTCRDFHGYVTSWIRSLMFESRKLTAAFRSHSKHAVKRLADQFDAVEAARAAFEASARLCDVVTLNIEYMSLTEDVDWALKLLEGGEFLPATSASVDIASDATAVTLSLSRTRLSRGMDPILSHVSAPNGTMPCEGGVSVVKVCLRDVNGLPWPAATSADISITIHFQSDDKASSIDISSAVQNITAGEEDGEWLAFLQLPSSVHTFIEFGVSVLSIPIRCTTITHVLDSITGCVSSVNATTGLCQNFDRSSHTVTSEGFCPFTTMCVSPTGTMLVADARTRVCRELDSTERVIRSFDASWFLDAVDVIACNGAVVALAKSLLGSTVLLFDYSTCEFLRSIGSRGTAPGQLRSCTDLCFSLDGSWLWVLDATNRRAQAFDTVLGNLLSSIDLSRHPKLTSIAVRPHGWAVVSDSDGVHVIQQLSGSVVYSLPVQSIAASASASVQVHGMKFTENRLFILTSDGAVLSTHVSLPEQFLFVINCSYMCSCSWIIVVNWVHHSSITASLFRILLRFDFTLAYILHLRHDLLWAVRPLVNTFGRLTYAHPIMLWMGKPLLSVPMVQSSLLPAIVELQLLNSPRAVNGNG